LVHFFLVVALVSSITLQVAPWFNLLVIAQAAFYIAALLAFLGVGFIRHSLLGKLALYFSMVNAAILVAWVRTEKE